MFKIAKWYNNFQAPSVLMIDDLSDAYIDVYNESYKNDWGYLCDQKGSSFDFLNEQLLKKFPKIKITFFVPYLRHNVINENSKFNYKKYAVGERKKFINFLKKLKKDGHEVAHHGSNHGQYIDINKPTTVNNWIHEWALFDDIETGVKRTLNGIEIFKKTCDINIVGGKYCGYISRENSEEIIDQCDFLYWCAKPSYNIGEYDECYFGKNNIISFPTNYAGNSFVRLTYLSGDNKRDKKKKILKYFQPFYNLYSYTQLYNLYSKGRIISIQEHNSPSTTAGTVQSANIISDIASLNKIFKLLSKLSIWYATCQKIAKYIYIRKNSRISVELNQLIIYFNNKRKYKDCVITLICNKTFVLFDGVKNYESIYRNKTYLVNLKINNGKNIYTFRS